MNPRLAVWIVNGLLVGLATLSLFPLLWMVSVSFMPAGASSTIPTPVLPGTVTLDNYRQLFGNVTCTNCRHQDAPSMRAASYRSSGIACRPARKMIML